MEKDESIFGLRLNNEVMDLLRSVAGWAFKLGIFLIILNSLTILQQVTSIIRTFRYIDRPQFIIMSIGSFLLTTGTLLVAILLIKFGNKMKRALNIDDEEYIIGAFTNLKQYFKITVILTIISCVLHLFSWIFYAIL